MKTELLSVLALCGFVGLGCAAKPVSLKDLKSPAVEVDAATSVNPDGGASITVRLSTDPQDCGVPGHDLHGTLDGVALTVSDPGGAHATGVLADSGDSTECDPVLLTLDNVTSFPEDSVLHLIDGSATWEIKVHHLGTPRKLTQVQGFRSGQAAAVAWSDATDPLDPASLTVTVNGIVRTGAALTVQGQEIHFTMPELASGNAQLQVENLQLVTACPSGVTCSTDVGRSFLDITVTP